MNDENDTQTFSAPSAGDSRLFGISVRALLTLMVIVTCCAVAILNAYAAFLAGEVDSIGIIEPVRSLALFIGGFYLAQKTQPKTP